MADVEDDKHYLTKLFPRIPSYELPLEGREWTFTGGRNEAGMPHGLGTLTVDGLKYEGRYQNGQRIGRGTLWLPDNTHIILTFGRDGVAKGDVTVTRPDGSYIVGTLGGPQGLLEGEVEEVDSKREPRFQGTYADGRPVGLVMLFLHDGGSVVGEVDDNGLLTGEVRYMYPDGTSLVGEWHDGAMHSAFYYPNGEDEPHTGIEFSYQPSTGTDVCGDRMLEDPYQASRVEVRPSVVSPAAGEGLFARTPLALAEVFAFYNGIRLHGDVVAARTWDENTNTMTLTEQVVLDVPPQISRADTYRMTLGHKCNHSFTPNSEFIPYWHPRFGYIIAMRTLKEVPAGEELTISYGYEMEDGFERDYTTVPWETLDAPEWFKVVGRDWASKCVPLKPKDERTARPRVFIRSTQK